MTCRDCPYIKDQYESIVELNVIQCEIPTCYGENISVEEMCYCDKLGGKVGWYGVCGDIACDCKNKAYFVPNKKRINKRNRNTKRERDARYKHKLEQLNKSTDGWWFAPVYKKQSCYDESKFYYKRCYYQSKYYKRAASRAVRKYDGDIYKGCSYKKFYEYSWSIY